MKRQAHEHLYEVKDDRAICKACGFSIPAALVCCVGCRQPLVTSWRVFRAGQGPFCSVKCSGDWVPTDEELTVTDEAHWHEVHDRIWAARPAEALKVVRGWMRVLCDHPELRQQLIEKLPTWRRP